MGRIFRHIGGVPTRIWFDNASTVVKEILYGGGRTLTDRFLRFTRHYGFEAAICNPDAGHEKGNVEVKVGYHRRNMLVPVPEFSDMAQYNDALLIECDKDGDREHYRLNADISELFALDRERLLPLPTTELDLSDYRRVKTNGYARFYLNKGTHEYSSAPKYANSNILIRLTSSTVSVLDDSLREVVRHRRLYGDEKQQSMQWLPYLRQIALKPRALKYSGIFDLMPEDVKLYFAGCAGGDASRMLNAIAFITERSSFEAAITSVSKGLGYGAGDADSVISVYRREFENMPDIRMELPMFVPAIQTLSPDLRAYDRALSLEGGGQYD